MTFVSDTSPLTNLAAISQLELLHQLYETILIPEAVYQELTQFDVPGSREVRSLGWIETATVRNTQLIAQLELELDPGEAAAIALAIEKQAILLLLDERRGTRVANRYGVRVQGVLGILLLSKARGLIPAVRPLLEQLVEEAGFWITDNLYEQVLRTARE